MYYFLSIYYVKQIKINFQIIVLKKNHIYFKAFQAAYTIDKRELPVGQVSG